MAFGHATGLPWWAAVLVALGCALLGALVDNLVSGDFGIVFGGVYLIGCVAAIGMVRRSNLFAPMVQPPLLVIVSVPIVALLVGSAGGSSGKAKLLSVGTSLINQFPVMAVATVLAVGIGVARIYLQKRPAPKAERGTRGAGQAAASGSRRPAAPRQGTGKPQSGSKAAPGRSEAETGQRRPRGQSQQRPRPEQTRGQADANQGGTERPSGGKPDTPAGGGQQRPRTPRREDEPGAVSRRGEQPARGNQPPRGQQPRPAGQPPRGQQPPPAQRQAPGQRPAPAKQHPPGQQTPEQQGPAQQGPAQRPARGQPAGARQPSRPQPPARDEQETRANPARHAPRQSEPGPEQSPGRHGESPERRESTPRRGRSADDRGLDAPWKRAFGRDEQGSGRDEPGSARDRARQIRENTERNVQRRTDSTRRPRRRPED